MTKLALQLEIPKRGGVCFRGNETLVPGMSYYSVLIEDGENPYQRKDYCSACWEQVCKEEELNAIKSYWKAKIPEKKSEIKLNPHVNRDARALELFKQGSELNETFVLALYLARKKILVLRKEYKNQGDDDLLYEELATGEMFYVKRVDLSLLQIQKIQEALVAKFAS